MNKQRKIKFIVAGSLAAVAGLALTSCGGSKSSKTTNYTVSFDVNDPDTTDSITLDAIEAVTVKKGATVTLTDLTYEGYTFGGWYTDSALTKKFTSTTAVESDLTLYAKWTKNAATTEKVTVTFNTNGGSNVDPVEVDKGSTVAEPTAPTLDGYDFDGWYTDEALTNAFDFATPITTTTTLYAKWVAAGEAGIDIPEGYEEITAALDLATVVDALGTGKKFDGAAFTSGMFTIDANKDLETRARPKTWTKKAYEGFDYVDKYSDVDGNTTWTSTHSLKLVQAAGVSFEALGNGNCRAYVQNGSGSAGNTVVLQIKDKTAGTTTDLEFPAASDGSPMVQVSFDVIEGHEYQVLRRDSGTIDLYKIELDMAVVKSSVTDIVVTTAGKSKFIAGMDFTSAGLSVSAVKENGSQQAIDNSDLTIDSSAVDFTTAGTYDVKVKYQNFETSYQVEVFDLADIELGFNKISKISNTAAGNGQYYNLTPQGVYSIGDEIDGDGLTIVAYTSDDSYFERFDVTSSFVSVSGFDSTTAGVKDVAITLTMNGVSKTENVEVYVVDTEIAKVVEDSVVTEANVYVDASYTGTIGAQVTYGTISKTCNTFTTIQQALDFLQLQDGLDTVRKNIYIAEGTYTEKIELTLPYLSLIGIGGAEKTTIIWDSLYGIEDESGFTHTTDSTQTVAVRESAVNCIIDGISIKNYYDHISKYDTTSYKDNGERGLALLVQADKFIMQNGALYGWQDTLETFTGRQYFKNTYICGCVDFIFGTNSTTYFDNCDIEVLKSKVSNSVEGKVAAYITAYKGQNKSSSDKPTYGAVFNGCNIHAADDFVGLYAIARPWTATSTVAYLNCTFDSKLATKESTTIATGLIKDCNVNTLDIKFYNNKFADNTAIALTDDLTNVDTTMTAAQVEIYNDYTKVFGVTTSGVVYTSAWNPQVTAVEIDNNTYYNFNGKSNPTGTNYAYNYITSTASEKITTLGGLTIDGTAGKVDVRTANGDTQLNKGAKISLKVEANTKLVISNYSEYHNYKVYGSVDKTERYANADTVSYFFEEAQTVTIEATGTVYLYQIMVMPDEEAPTAATITSLSLSTSSVKTTYDEGETLSTDGIVVNANYSDGTYIPLDSTAYTIDTDSVDMTTAGVYDVVVILNANTTIAANYKVTVNKASTSIATNTNITFGSSGNYSTVSKLDTSAATLADNSKDTTSTMITGTLTFPVLAGAKVYVYGYKDYTNYTIQAGTQVVSDTITSQHNVYEVTADSIVTISCGDNCYLYGIYIVYPIEETTTYTYGATVNASTNTYGLTGTTGDGLIFQGDFNTGNTIQFKSTTDNAIILYVKAGATVVVTGHSADYGILTVKAGKTTVTQDGDTYTYTATADTTITITAGSSGTQFSYVRAISITYSE